jgi:ribosomal protein S9
VQVLDVASILVALTAVAAVLTVCIIAYGSSRRSATELTEARRERLRLDAEEVRRKAEDEERLRLDAEEARRKAEEEERLRLEAEEARRKAEEEERLRLDAEEARRKAEEEERLRLDAEEARRKAEEEERLRLEAEEVRRRAEEEERLRLVAEEAKRKAEDDERLRLDAEEAKRKAEEEERLRLVAEEAKRKAEDDERLRLESEEVRRKAAEEERLRLKAEEARHKAAEEERLRLVAEGAKRKAEDDEQLRLVAERARVTADGEERPRLETEEDQPKVDEEERLSLETEEAGRLPRVTERRPRKLRGQPETGSGHKREPEDRGGGRFSVTRDGAQQPPRQLQPLKSKPEVVCWQRERQWLLGIEVAEESTPAVSWEVSQADTPLRSDERSDCRFLLENAFGEVLSRCGERSEVVNLGEKGRNWMLFQLSGASHNQGRRVNSPSCGSFLVVVPQGWQRDEQLAGTPVASPEAVSVDGYLGHFFDLKRDADSLIAFRTPEDELIQIRPRGTEFALVGKLLRDANENTGPLFGVSTPRIRCLSASGWASIRSIVIGQEGRGRGKWRRSFIAAPEGGDLTVPAVAEPSRDGWYFLRLYDANGDLVESLDFRLVRALREIRIVQPEAFPCEDRHESVTVEFCHEPGFFIQPADGSARRIKVDNSEDRKTTLTIPPQSACDETRWRVGSDSRRHVDLTVLIERIWWAIGPDNAMSLDWSDELAHAVCGDFAPTSKKAIWLLLPKPRWADSIKVGFGAERAQPCLVNAGQREVAKPLRDFCDSREIGDRDRDHFLKVWIQREGERSQGTPIMIPASLGPIICIACGKKEAAEARAVLRKGSGTIRVNGKDPEQYFRSAPSRCKQFMWRLRELPDVAKALANIEASIEVIGSSPRTIQQVKASTHALARALMKHDPPLRAVLKHEGFGGARVPDQPRREGESG